MRPADGERVVAEVDHRVAARGQVRPEVQLRPQRDVGPDLAQHGRGDEHRLVGEGAAGVQALEHRTGHRRFAAISLELRIYCGGDGSLRRHRQWMFRLCGPQGRNSQQGRGHSNSRAQHEMHHEIAQPLRHTTSYNTNRRGDNAGLLSLCRMVSLNG